MPNKINAIGSPSRAMGKKRRMANRTGGQRMQNEEIPQKKDGAGRRRPAKKTQGADTFVRIHLFSEFFGIAIELHVGIVMNSMSNIRYGLENVVSGNGGVYRWVTLGPPPPHLIEGRPTPANRWGTNNWSIGNTSVFPGHSPW
ncbi:Hypothetical predicted protein [Mytilus galloprovincialis]|uniref:Uncharacterized protein n=1 Tax=Mytilus galloprovincialis TaxID=29158 RepID=A0A8B6FBR1_MYTGA|nr:Hypothetical predicted protein [Mytilus galloprovincialis]